MNDSTHAGGKRRTLTVATVAVLLGIGAALAWRGWGFYGLSLDNSVDHKDFRILRPAGTIGHAYGFIGTFLIFTNLLYLLRRKLARWRLGSMRTWLDIHVFTGLSGSIFVAFHTAFHLRTPIATGTAVSLAIVVFTGLLGRYIYALVPVRDSSNLDNDIAALNRISPGLSHQIKGAVATLPSARVTASASFARKLVAILGGRRHRRMRAEVVALTVHNAPGVAALPAEEQRYAESLAIRVAEALAAQTGSLVAESVMRAWRALHRFFAILLLLMVSVHIYIAWHYGYRWLFSE